MTKLRRRLTQEDVDRIVEMGEVQRAYFERAPDRPDSKFMKPRGRVPIEVRRAQGRLRTARWRSELDKRKRPTAEQVGMALVESLVTGEFATLADRSLPDYGLVRRALINLQNRGFDVDQTKEALRKLRNRM